MASSPKIAGLPDKTGLAGARHHALESDASLRAPPFKHSMVSLHAESPSLPPF